MSGFILSEDIDIKEECSGGRWKEDKYRYYMEDDLFDEYLSVNKVTRKIVNTGFTGFLSQWIIEGKAVPYNSYS